MGLRKRIAVLSSQLEERYQKEFIEGFYERAFSLDYDVCVFSSFQKEPESNLRAIGETNIFNLINYERFDGIVVLPDVLQVSGLMMSIEKKLRGYKGKVLYVDRESDIYPFIMIDHYRPLYNLIAHLIDDHGYKDIAFITGHKWHIHSKQRLQAFLDCMKDHNLEIGEDRIFYGDYWYDGGANVIKEFVAERRVMPDAFACANDYMAIGVCGELQKNGYSIPEDVAVTGYDSVKEGERYSIPITSVPLPTRDFGVHAAQCMHDLIKGIDFPEFYNHSPIFYGSSCGCHNESIDIKANIASEIDYTRTYFGAFNRLTEDMVLQTTFQGLIDIMQTYTYMIREFESFTLCLNSNWLDESLPVSEYAIKEGYSTSICPILQCGISGKGADRIDYETRFDTSEMFPAIYEECDHPRGFIFSPIFFEDNSFGYSVMCYGDMPQSYTESYYLWERSVMIGFECYRRNAILKEQNSQQEVQIYDKLTGMFNYDGFIKHAKPMVERGISINNYIFVLAIDLNGLDKINSKFGRKAGDQAISDLAHIISDSSDEGAMCCRLGNDEFIISELTPDANPTQIHVIQRRIDKKLTALNNTPGREYSIRIFTGYATERISNLAQMEDLVNNAVSQKNGNKAAEHRLMNSSDKLNDDEKIICDIVKKILDENLFKYHFQPIVDAKTGEIFSYEALMRADVEQRISPLDILKYATHLDRLKDVEKATLYNVLTFVNDNNTLFEGKKVFINSIPGNQLVGQEAAGIEEKLKSIHDQVVIELTEQTEAEDDAFERMKERFTQLGVETAVDDYGTGYSNIVNLLRYMPNYVKIDRMLLSNIQDNPQKQHFVKDIVLFAHDNHFKVLAEGIETYEELRTVIDLNVDLIQGYYTAKPQEEVIQAISEEIAQQIRTCSGIADR